MDSNTKLYIRVDGVIGSRRRICTFCHSTIEGVEKVVETTRKLRRGPYFPQLAYLDSSIGKIDSLGRAVVCLSCFHQLLRQWSNYENNNVPLQRRTYKYVSDKGVKNYQETRAAEIRKEAEKRAFAVHTKQDGVLKKSFAKLTRTLDIEEDTINTCENRILELKKELKHCTKGEKWKINREIQKQKKLIKIAEAKIEEEEDKEEEIRKETKKLLEAYKKNSSLFRATSEPSLFSGTKEDIVMSETDIDSFSPGEKSRDSGYFDRVDFGQVPSSKGVSKASSSPKLRQSDDDLTGFSGGHQTVINNQMDSDDVWSQIRPSRSRSTSGGGHTITTEPLDEEWHLVKEIVYSPKPDVHSQQEDVWSSIVTQNNRNDNIEVQDRDNQDVDIHWQFESHTDVMRETLVEERSGEDHSGLENDGGADDIAAKQHSHGKSEEVFVKQVSRPVQSFPDDEWSQLFTDQDEDEREENEEGSFHPTPFDDETLTENDSHKSLRKDSSTDDDDDDEEGRQQTYTVNKENSPGFQQTERHYEFHSKHEIPNQRSSPTNDFAESAPTSISNGGFLDPWDNIEIEKKKDNCQTQLDISELQAKEDSSGDESDQGFPYGKSENVVEKEVLSPRRLDRSRFNSFTKTFGLAKPVKPQTSTDKSETRPAQQASQRKTEKPEVTIVERQSNHVQEQEMSLQSNKNSRNVYERHLSVEEEEWEQKRLNPKRLNSSKSFKFFNQTINETDSKETYQKKKPQQDNYERNNNERNPKPSKSKVKSDTNGDVKKLVRQDEVAQEQFIQKTVTKGSLRSDPWESVDSSGSLQHKNSINKREHVDSERSSQHSVGRLDLKRWNSEMERNEIPVKTGDDVTMTVVDTRQSDGYITKTGKNTSNQNTNPAKSTGLLLQNETSEAVQIDETEAEPQWKPPTDSEHDGVDDYITKRPIGRVDLSVWEQNSTSQHDVNGQARTSRTSDTKANDHSLGPKPVQRTTSYDINIEQNRPLSDDIHAPVAAPRQNVDANVEAPLQEANRRELLRNEPVISSRSPFNQNMSEDEIEWEKRFSKSYERESSSESEDEESVMNGERTEQNISSTFKIAEPPRLDENSNLVDIGNISLSEKEVERVREVGQSQRFQKSLSTNQDNKHPDQVQFSSTQSETSFSDDSQFSEEEAWERRRGNPGKLDLSKFSQFR